MDIQCIFDYLKELQENNNRDWYHGHKNEQLYVNEQFEHLLRELILEIGKFDKSILHNEPKNITFKLVRDIRYSHDKSPYNATFRAHIAPAGKLPIPVGYFISIKPNNKSFLGGGLFAPMFRDATSMIRDYISKNGKEFDQIIKDMEFAGNFEIKGESLKNVPSGYDKNHPQAEYLKFKSWFIEDFINDDKFLNADNFIQLATERFKLMKPFNDYLNIALQSFTMPTR